jgi:hypothetical protein
MDPRLERYLNASHRLLTPVNQQVRASYYARLFNILEESFHRYAANHIHGFEPGPFPAPTLIYSNDRMCQVVKQTQGLHLVYDQYLGETFNLLTRIVYHARNVPDYAEAFGLKCIAQRLVSRGLLNEARWIALYCTGLQPKNPLPKFDTTSNRGLITMAQELFIMAHEVCHHFVKRNVAFHALQMVTAEIAFHEAKSYGTHPPPKRNRRSIAKKYGFPVSVHAWKQAVKVKLDFWEAHKADYLEEIACDQFARDVVLDFARTSGFGPVIGFTAVMLAVRYLRILHYCKAMAACFGNEECIQPLNQDVQVTQMREHVLQASFPMAYKNVFGQPDSGYESSWAAVRAALDLINDQVDENLHDPIVYRLPRFIESVMKDKEFGQPIPREDGTFFSRDEILDLVEEATGPNV